MKTYKKLTQEFLEAWKDFPETYKKYGYSLGHNTPEKENGEQFTIEELQEVILDLAEHGNLTRDYTPIVQYINRTLVAKVSGDRITVPRIPKAKDILKPLARMVDTRTSRVSMRGIYHCPRTNCISATDGASMVVYPVYPQKVDKGFLYFPRALKSEGIEKGDKYYDSPGYDYNLKYPFPDFHGVTPKKNILTMYPMNVDEVRRKLKVLSQINNVFLHAFKKLNKKYVGTSQMPVYGKAYVVGSDYKTAYNSTILEKVIRFLLASGADTITFGIATAKTHRSRTPIYLEGDNGAYGLVMPIADDENPQYNTAYFVLQEV